MKKTVLILVLGAILLSLAPVQSAQFLFLERRYTMKGNNRVHLDWEFYTGLHPELWAPKNWVSPVNYYQGKYHLEAQVISMTNTSNNNNFCIGWKNFKVVDHPQIPHNHTWEGKGNFKSPTTIVQDTDVSDMWYGVDSGPNITYSQWDWTQAWGDFLYCYINPHGQNPFPVEMRVKLYIISKGSSYSPFSQTVAAPVITPAGGTSQGPTYMWITCATPGARIFYNTGGNEVDQYDVEYTGPVAITRDVGIVARAFKDQYNSSPETAVDFVVAPNTTPLSIESVNATSSTTVDVKYSTYPLINTAEKNSAYSINNGVTIIDAVLSETDKITVTLTVSTMPDGNYTLTVNNVRDMVGNYVAANTQVNFGYGVSINDDYRQISNIDHAQPALKLYTLTGNYVRGAFNRQDILSRLPSGVYLLVNSLDQTMEKMVITK